MTGAAGIEFVHFDSATPMHYIHETMGSGLGWIDYDADGWLDLFCVQDCPVTPNAASAPLPTNKLFRNNRDGTFTDVTKQVGLDRSGFGMGCAVGDYDNDGYADLVVTYLGGVALYHNVQDGKGGRRFVDVTAKAGIRNRHFATSCGWGDVDGDGLLDLYVCNYVEIDLERHPICDDNPKRLKFSCPPTLFPTTTHRLWKNQGGGKFADVSDASGIAKVTPAPGLGVLLIDLDGDGHLDIYVANDLRPAYLFHNQGGGKFVEKALVSGCGLGPNGQEVAGMGIDAADVDGTGRPALVVTNFQGKPNVLYKNQGNLLFQEWSGPAGLAGPSLDKLGFGVGFADVDLDGNLEMAVVNGHVARTSQEVFGVPFAQEAQLFLGLGNGKFRDVSPTAGPYFRSRYVGRGLAWGDFNNDGKPDLALSHNGGPVVLAKNATATKNNWIRLELEGDYAGTRGKKSNRDAVGTRVEIMAGGRQQVRWIAGGGSYLSAGDRRILVGLGVAANVDRITVSWPSGSKQIFQKLAAGKTWKLTEGSPVAPAAQVSTP